MALRPPASPALRPWLFGLLTALMAVGPDTATAQGMDHLFAPPSGGRFVHVSSYDTTGGNRDRHEVAPGDTVTLLDMDGPGIVRRLWLTVASRDPHYLRRIALEMYWDDESEPSVRVPLGDFFGNGFDRRHYAARPMGVSSGGFYSYLPLPFGERARIVAINGTGRVVDAFYFNADVELDVDLPDPLPTFHARWHRDPRTTAPHPHRVLEASGRGRFVGLSLNAESYDGNLFFLEGDEVFVVDGEFRGQGTGTEDYFNGGWYFEAGEFAAAWHGVVVKDDERGRIAAYRWHVPDPIPFRDSIRVELEHGHADEVVADYATTAYWYQVEPHRPFPALPTPDERRVLGVKIPPGATLRDSLRVLETEGDRRRVRVHPAPTGADDPGAARWRDRYEVIVYPAGGPGRAAAHVRVIGPEPTSGEPVTVGLEAPEADVVLPPVVVDTVANPAGREGPRDGTAEVELEILGGPDALPAAVQLRPLRQWATEWMAVGPFPNPQRLGTEHNVALDRSYPPERDPSLEASYLLPSGDSATWAPIEGDDTGYVRLNPHFEPNDWVAAYVQAFLHSPTARDAVLWLGADDGHVLWLNGREVSRRQGRNIAVVDDLAVPVRLEAGWNRVVMKVADLDGGWAFRLRAGDPTGELRWSRRPGG